MKTTAYFHTNIHELNPQIFEGVVRLYPQGRSGSTFSWLLPADHPVVRATTDFLSSHGLKLTLARGKKKNGEYEIIFGRQYVCADWESARYLEPAPVQKIGEYEIRPYGEPLVIRADRLTSLGDKLSICVANGPWIIVSERIRLKMQEAALLHVAFVPVRIIDATPQNRRLPVWELRSDLTLPPLSPRCELVDWCGAPFDGDIKKGCYLVEKPYGAPEMHYSEAAIRSVEPFDLALTHERFGPNEVQADHGRVASQRFYKFCAEQGFDMRWIPVHIDPD